MPASWLAAAGIGGNLLTGIMGSNAAGTASGQEVGALQQGLGTVQNMYGTTQGNFQPYMAAGTNALGGLQSLLGLTPGGPGAAATLASMPGYQFTLGQGMSAINDGASAQGMVQSGNTLRALQQFGQGLAGTTYGNYVNQLGNMSNAGLSATGTLGALSGNASSTMAQLLSGIGAARAAGTVGSSNALAGGITGALNTVGSMPWGNGTNNGTDGMPPWGY